jgi:hypothetical protein
VKSLRSRRFETFCLGLVVVALLGAFGLYLHADAATLAVVLGHAVGVSAIALGAGHWHDRGVRVELARAGGDSIRNDLGTALERRAEPPTP